MKRPVCIHLYAALHCTTDTFEFATSTPLDLVQQAYYRLELYITQESVFEAMAFVLQGFQRGDVLSSSS